MPPPSHAPDVQLDGTLRLRAVGLSLGLVTMFSLLGWRLVNLHVGQTDTFQEAARQPYSRAVVLPAPRGAVFDARGEVLAADRRAYAVVVDRNLLRDQNLALRTVSAMYGKSVAEVRRHFTDEQIQHKSVTRCLRQLAPKLGLSVAALNAEIGDSRRGEVVVKKEVNEGEVQALKDFIEAESLPGVLVRESMRRLYPYPDSGVHVLGFTNGENVGVDGIEKSMNAVLRGVAGRQWMDRDPRGGEVPSTTRGVEPPQPGRSIRLTLDHGVQRLVEAQLDLVGDQAGEVYLPLLRARGVTVVLMDPATNAVIAMANRPHHTLSDLRTITPNRAVAETFEPGSTFKLGAYAGALDQRLVGLATPLHLHGGYYHKGEIRIKDQKHFNQATVLNAFAYSSNIAAYKLASQLGAARFHRTLCNLGFGQRTEIDLPNEASGQLRTLDKWGTLSLRSVSFGYEVNVTPLQLLNAYAAVVNGGVMRKPRLVDAVLDETGGVVDNRPPDEGRRVCSPTAAGHLRTAMLEVVRKGSAKQAAIPGFLVGGKTGTARKYIPKRKMYVEGAYVLSFVGFVESVDGAQLVGVVVIDDPDVPANTEYGGQLAAPVFRRICSAVLAHRGVDPNPAWMPDFAGE